jgi:acetyltransferase
VGYEILANIINGGFEGRIYPINKKAKELNGLPCYPDLESIGQVPDLVLLIVPAPSVPEVLRQCAQIKAKSVIIVTAGFKEVGAQGLKLEEQIVQIAHQNGIRFIGPNCLGLMSTAGKLNASFGGDMPVSGAIGYLIQDRKRDFQCQ